MGRYSVADAKNGLPRLIDKAAAGEEVIITRHGAPVAELRPIVGAAAVRSSRDYDWLRARRDERAAVAITSVELLNQMYDEKGD